MSYIFAYAKMACKNVVHFCICQKVTMPKKHSPSPFGHFHFFFLGVDFHQIPKYKTDFLFFFFGRRAFFGTSAVFWAYPKNFFFVCSGCFFSENEIPKEFAVLSKEPMQLCLFFFLGKEFFTFLHNTNLHETSCSRSNFD